MQIKFTASKFEIKKIVAIAQRADSVAKDAGVRYDYTAILMDLEACHCNGTPLDLDGLLTANPLDFSHDIFGIRRHIDRDTGKLCGIFQPRHAMGKVTT